MTLRDNSGDILFSDYTNSNGCTSAVPTTDGPIDAEIVPIYENPVTDFRYTVRDCTSGTCTLPTLVEANIPMSGAKETIELATDPVLDAYVPLGFILARLAKNYYSGTGWHNFTVEVGSATGPTATDWYLNQPRLRLNLNKARAKYTIGHEFGHVLQLEELQTPSGVLDCSYGSGGAENHTLDSPEYASCAATEGLGHYISTAAWNDFTENDGVFVTFAENPASLPGYRVSDAEVGSKEILAHCSGSACCGLGMEMDWARTWWDWRTNGGLEPHVLDAVSVFDEAHPYPYAGADNCTPGHYDAIETAVGSLLGSTQETRFISAANFNGIDIQ